LFDAEKQRPFASSSAASSRSLSPIAAQAFMNCGVPASAPEAAASRIGWHMSMISPSCAPDSIAIATDRFQI
jgi:hypothetical protein